VKPAVANGPEKLRLTTTRADVITLLQAMYDAIPEQLKESRLSPWKLSKDDPESQVPIHGVHRPVDE
jgi:hypothetical protein